MTTGCDLNQEISKINNYIYLGSYEPAYMDTEEFRELKIDVIINCAAEITYPKQSKYIIEQFPFEDDDNSTLLEYIDEANDKIHKYLSAGKKIYIHCYHGISRSPAILVYYLMSHKRFTYDRAVKLLKKIRPIIQINSNFERELKSIEE